MKKEGAQSLRGAYLLPHGQDLDKGLLPGAKVEICKLMGIRSAVAVYGDRIVAGGTSR